MRLIRRAVEILHSGGIVIYPTDTVYGMGCDLFNKK
ncbi:MAG: Sua5/YciO/YrdC/YwlC family protein, partial [Deltaproteobacteria bacterium]